MYDDVYGKEPAPGAAAAPGRTWTDVQIDANSYLVALLQGTHPPVGIYPFSTAARFAVIIGSMARLLNIEYSARVFQEALLGAMGYDFDKVMAGKTEYESRSDGV